MLSCRVGMKYVEDVEDAVQSALMSALESWTIADVPDNPTAWLFRAARNNLMGTLRTQGRRYRILQQNASDFGRYNSPEVILPDDMQDDLLRMLFVCCHETIPLESQLVFALKTLCGFDVREIAIRLFTSEANVYKRLSRARNRLQELPLRADDLKKHEYLSRLPAVQKVLYLLFTEGYLSSDASEALRRDLCNEAIRLASILAGHPVGQSPETYALLAMMHLHLARIDARETGTGHLLLLEEQDRCRWNQDEIQQGMRWLAKSAEGESFSRYHAEAGIAAEHCLAPSFTETRWEKIAECYSLLAQFTDSPIHKLNRAIAVAEWKGPAEGLAILDGYAPPTWLSGSYMWTAVMADLHRRCGKLEAAQRFGEVALSSAPTPQVKELLRRRLRLDKTD